jgi:hypothetical protein
MKLGRDAAGTRGSRSGADEGACPGGADGPSACRSTSAGLGLAQGFAFRGRQAFRLRAAHAAAKGYGLSNESRL